MFGSGQQPRDLIHISPEYIGQSRQSSVIKADPSYPTVSANGYDGQFFYYLALDPLNARYYMDAPTYRYTRILYPLVARALALGRPELIPITLLVVNWLALAGGTMAIAAWLKRRGLSPWIALVYGLYPGLHFALARDLSEVLAYGLAATAVLLFDVDGRRRWLLSAVVFALAGLTRETTALFSLAFGAALYLSATKDRWQAAGGFLSIALLPLALYKGFLLLWLGPGQDAGVAFAALPFAGLWHWRAQLDTLPLVKQVIAVVLPGLIAGTAAVLALLNRRPNPSPARGSGRAAGNDPSPAPDGGQGAGVAPWLLLANVLLFVVFLQWASYADYGASGRIGTGIVLSAILCLPVKRDRGWFWASSALWLSLVPFMLVFPTARYLLHLLLG